MTDRITLAHGSGGRATSELIGAVFAKYFQNDVLDQMEDAAVVSGSGRIAMTTDSFVVDPIEFPGGDIGRLCVCGTVNDLLMSGATPKYLTCGFILEEGVELATLERVVASMAETAKEAGVLIVAGDTKVIQGKGGIYINTAGVGFVPDTVNVSSSHLEEGDVILVSGEMGEHHATILSQRMEIENDMKSDNAPLCEMVEKLKAAGIPLHAMRDVTRGGLGTVLHEFAVASQCCIEIQETKIPVSPAVKGFASLLGLDPLYMGNEGKMILALPAKYADIALDCMKSSKYGEKAAMIGEVTHEKDSKVLLHTAVGGMRVVTELIGEGLPRIC